MSAPGIHPPEDGVWMVTVHPPSTDGRGLGSHRWRWDVHARGTVAPMATGLSRDKLAALSAGKAALAVLIRDEVTERSEAEPARVWFDRDGHVLRVKGGYDTVEVADD